MPEPVDHDPPTGPSQAQALSRGTATPTRPRGAAPAPNFGPPKAAGEVGTLGRYRVRKELGRGGMGAVYLAHDTHLQRNVALKVMLPQFAADRDAKERFLREARAAARIDHDNVVRVHEAAESAGVPYIAMQFLRGCALDRFLRSNRTLTLAQIVQLGIEAASGLSAAHALGLVHRDIKPANLWLEAPNGRVKVLDFGLARAISTGTEHTVTGVEGTPAYMSLEQARGLRVDHRADLYSLGAVLYRLCTGRPPFQGPDTMAVLVALVADEPEPVRALNPEVPEPLAALIHQLLAKNPSARPQTADAVIARLSELLLLPEVSGTVGPQVVYVPASTAAPENNAFAGLDESDPDMTEIEATAAERTAGPSIRARAQGRGPWPVVAGAAALAIGAVAVAFLALNKKDRTPSVEPSPVASAAAPAVGVPGTSGTKVSPRLATGTPGGRPGGMKIEMTPDREAALRVFARGGTVKIDGEDNQLASEKQLPDGRFTLTGISIVNKGDTVTVADWECFAKCKGIKELNFSSTNVNDAGLFHFKGYTELTSIGFSSKGVTDTGLDHLKGCKELTHLGLNGTGVTDKGLVQFKGFTKLTVLGLSHSAVTDDGLKNFKDCKQLWGLSLCYTEVTDKGLENFKDCDKLAQLNISKTKVTDKGFENFKDCQKLVELFVHDTDITDAGLAILANCRSLRDLDVRNTKITREGAQRLHEALPRCRIETDWGPIGSKFDAREAAEYVLSVGGAVRVNGADRDIRDKPDLPKGEFTLTRVDLVNNQNVTNAGLKCFAGCTGLKELELNGAAVTDAGLVHFKGATELTSLALSGKEITDAGVSNFKNCTRLTFLFLPCPAVTDTGLAHFKDCAELEHVYLTGTAVTDAGVAHLAGCKKLRYVSLADTRVTDPGLVHLKGRELRYLNLTKTGITDAGLAIFEGLTSVTYLALSDTKVTNVGLAHFAGCSGLNHLYLSAAGVTDAGLAHFKDCKSLMYCTLVGSGVTEACLAQFRGYPILRTLDVSKTNLSPKAIEEFARAAPECKITHNGGTTGPKK